MFKLVELGNCHNFKDGVFEMASDKGGKLETLHWSDSFSSFFIEKYSDFILIDGTRNINIYDISLVIITVVDSLGVSIPAGFSYSFRQCIINLESSISFEN